MVVIGLVGEMEGPYPSSRRVVVIPNESLSFVVEGAVSGPISLTVDVSLSRHSTGYVEICPCFSCPSRSVRIKSLCPVFREVKPQPYRFLGVLNSSICYVEGEERM